MTSMLMLPPVALPPIPGDEVLLTVDVDRSRCASSTPSIERRLTQLETQGLTVPISKIIGYASIHFQAADPAPGAPGSHLGQITQAWTLLARWNPRAVSHNGHPRLVVTRLGNPRLQSVISEVLGVGVALVLANHIFGIPFRRWAPTGLGATDYVTPSTSAGRIEIEARGRFNRNNWAAAVAEVEEKIAAGGTFDRAAGILFGPRDRAERRASDVLIMDPEGSADPEGPYFVARTMVRHYARQYRTLGATSFGARLDRIAASSDREFERYLRHGDEELVVGTVGPNAFRIGSHFFRGSWVNHVNLPRVLMPREHRGPCNIFAGMWMEVSNALRAGRVGVVADMEVKGWARQTPRSTQIVLDDGLLFAIVPPPT